MNVNTANTQQKNKKAVIFYCSPKKNSHTGKMVDFIIQNTPSNIEIITVDIYNNHIKPCVDCGYCKTHLGCIYNDMDYIDELLNTADYLIVASPIYNLSFPSPFKAVLDRFQRYFCARFSHNIKPPIKKHKDAIFIASCGRDKNQADFAIRQLKMVFTVLNTTLKNDYIWANTDSENSECDFNKLLKITKDLYLN